MRLHRTYELHAQLHKSKSLFPWVTVKAFSGVFSVLLSPSSILTSGGIRLRCHGISLRAGGYGLVVRVVRT